MKNPVRVLIIADNVAVCAVNARHILTACSAPLRRRHKLRLEGEHLIAVSLGRVEEETRFAVLDFESGQSEHGKRLVGVRLICLFIGIAASNDVFHVVIRAEYCAG